MLLPAGGCRTPPPLKRARVTQRWSNSRAAGPLGRRPPDAAAAPRGRPARPRPPAAAGRDHLCPWRGGATLRPGSPPGPPPPPPPPRAQSAPPPGASRGHAQRGVNAPRRGARAPGHPPAVAPWCGRGAERFPGLDLCAPPHSLRRRTSP